jgi:hypothetical protein
MAQDATPSVRGTWKVRVKSCFSYHRVFPDRRGERRPAADAVEHFLMACKSCAASALAASARATACSDRGRQVDAARLMQLEQDRLAHQPGGLALFGWIVVRCHSVLLSVVKLWKALQKALDIVSGLAQEGRVVILIAEADIALAA